MYVMCVACVCWVLSLLTSLMFSGDDVHQNTACFVGIGALGFRKGPVR